MRWALTAGEGRTRWKRAGGVDVATLTHRLPRYHEHEFVMMLESVGCREIVVQCGYGDSGRTAAHGNLVFTATR